MRRHLCGIVLVFIASGINQAAACEEPVPTVQPPAETQQYQSPEDSSGEYAYSNPQSNYKFAGIGIGGMLLAATAAFAIAKRR